ncbi:DNA/RNA non-specific endonuclease [Flavobacterium sp. UW10123]|uniref:DNA/RNA non-specific endonuclease n=1 Tax=Flavobacterium sp. UW10123 TaxID=3230800 RepID=UPI00339777B7
MAQDYQKISENKIQATAANANCGKTAIQLKDNREHSVIQQKLAEKTANQEAASSPIQAKKNFTGLPDNLKSGIENLSGHSMDDVKVHYNSDKPAQLNAHAYAQGSDIHIASGQEKHLPHEAWHVVQQKQGRVRPTIQMKGKANVNDDKILEKEADVMGVKALQLKPNKSFEKKIKKELSRSNKTLQKKIKNVSGTVEKTPAGAITEVLKVSGKELNLPGVQPVGDLYKAGEVEAEIKKSTLRSTERTKDGNLSKVTSMARAEQLLLQGADIKKFYDAGHLVADQLAGKKDNTFEMWNLAPQISEFNSPAYAQTMEEQIKKVANAGGSVTVNVKVGYDSTTYPVEVRKILDLQIIKHTNLGPTHIKIGSKIHPIAILDEIINIPRRIPVTWNMKAVTGGKAFPLANIPSGPGGAANKAVDPTTIPGITPNIGNKFAFGINNSANDGQNLTLAPTNNRELTAKQWAPSLHGVHKDDVVAWIASTFPELGNADAIVQALSRDKQSVLQLLHQAHHSVEQKYERTILSLANVLDPTLLEELITNKIEAARALLDKANELVKAGDLDQAIKKIINADSAVEDLNAAIKEAISTQNEQFVFPLHIVQHLQRSVEEFNTAKTLSPEFRHLANAHKQFAGALYDVKGKSEWGGSFEFFHFGAPCMVEEPILIGSPMEAQMMVVIASRVVMIQPGVWEITYRYPGK